EYRWGIFTCQGIFFIEKQGLVTRLGRVCGSVAVLPAPSALFLDGLPVRKAFLSAIQADLSCTPLFHDALCLDVFVP
ncbi:MAG: hypothetical protein WAW09_01545, partial [Smithella sp.]